MEERGQILWQRLDQVFEEANKVKEKVAQIRQLTCINTPSYLFLDSSNDQIWLR
jgi:hypothetical protein